MTHLTQSGPLKTFLRGGQVTLHTLRMFGQVMRFIALAMITVVLAIAYGGVMLNTSGDQRHYAMKWYEAWAYQKAGTNGDKKLNMRTADGTHAPFAVDVILAHPAVQAHEKAFREILVLWSTIGAVGGGVGFVLVVGLFIGRGANLTRTSVKRGSSMTTAGDLRAQISAHNRWRMVRNRSLRARPRYTLAGVPYPIGSEVQHTAISGTIGSGKTQAIAALLEQIRANGDRAVVFDLTGGFIGPFYRASQDIILNPLDARSPAWSVFSEASSKAGFDAAAAAMIPRGHKGDPVWVDSARTVFSTAAQLLVGDGRATNAALVETLLNTDLSTLGAFFAGTPAATIVSDETPRMSNSVRMMLSTYLDCFRLLPSEGDPFCISEWVRNEDAAGTIFLSSRADMHETLKPLLTVWMDTAVRALMSQARDPSRRVWFILDEVAALQKLPSIMDGLARGRQFGAAFVLGVQAQSQMRDIYGIDGAQSLSSVCRTKLILAAADADTAKWYADFLGRQETSRSNENVSFGANTIRDGVVVARQDRIEHLVIPEEIMNLRSLEGFLKMPESFPLARVKISLVLRDDVVAPFAPRPDQTLLIKRSPTAPAAGRSERSSGRPKDGGAGQRDMFADEPLGDSQPAPHDPPAGCDAAESAPAPARSSDRFPDWDMEP